MQPPTEGVGDARLHGHVEDVALLGVARPLQVDGDDAVHAHHLSDEMRTGGRVVGG